jgi:signal transduction histidine kinase
MTIRIRLTLWYAGILFASTLLISALLYHEITTLKVQPHGGLNDDDNDAPEDAVQMVLSCAIPAAALGLAGGWWLMRKSLEPVSALTRAAAGIHERNLRTELPRSGNGDELDRLTEVFNAMTARLDDSFNRIREFTLHASHELKTPLTVMHGELETALHNESNPAIRERLTSQLDEIQRLAKIVDGLSLLTKADAGQVVLDRKPLRFDELVRDCVEDAQILAQPSRVSVSLEACEDAPLAGDRHRLRQLLLNLTDNAVKYNHASGRVAISLRRTGEWAELEIANTGAGIPPEMQNRVFDRFFRGDLSHNNGIDGCGLGLCISQWIVKAHGGSIQLTSLPAELTTVRVQLPMAAAPIANGK